MSHRKAYREKRQLDEDRENRSPCKKFLSPVLRLADSERKNMRLSSSDSLNSLENQVLSLKKSALSEISSNRTVRPSEDFTDDSQMDLDQAFVKADSMQAYVSKPKQENMNDVWCISGNSTERVKGKLWNYLYTQLVWNCLNVF